MKKLSWAFSSCALLNILFSIHVLALPDSGTSDPSGKCPNLLKPAAVSKTLPPSGLYGEITGPVVIIGFGSIGKGVLPLLERHFKYDKSRLVVIDPSGENRSILDAHGIKYITTGLTKDNYKQVLIPLLKNGGGQGFCVNLSVDVGSVDVMRA